MSDSATKAVFLNYASPSFANPPEADSGLRVLRRATEGRQDAAQEVAP